MAKLTDYGQRQLDIYEQQFKDWLAKLSITTDHEYGEGALGPPRSIECNQPPAEPRYWCQLCKEFVEWPEAHGLADPASASRARLRRELRWRNGADSSST